MIKEITQFIANKAGLTRDTDIFAGHRLVDTADECDVILETAGGTAYFDLPERADIVIQVLSRAKTYFDARTRAYVIYDAIFRNWEYGSAGWKIGPVVPGGDEYQIMTITPLAIPQWAGLDEKKRFEFSTNYVFRIKKL